MDEPAMKKLFNIVKYNLDTGSSHMFHSGPHYQIVFVIHGMCRFLENIQQLCRPSDIIFLKPGQTQEIVSVSQKSNCRLLGITIPEESLVMLSDPTCDLAANFRFAPYNTAVIPGEMKSTMLLRNMITKLDTLKDEDMKPGIELYEKSLFTTFLVLFLRTCIQSDQMYQFHQKKMLMIDDVFEYISQHLTEDLSLKKLEEVFFISGEHISREFKKSTGVTLHSYITRARIDLSKKYLLQDLSVRDVCQLCGFSSYNHFFKMFKKECGMTPMEYYQKTCEKKDTDRIF